MKIEFEPIDRDNLALVRKYSKLEWESISTGKSMEELKLKYAKAGLWDKKWNSHLRQQKEFQDLWKFLKEPAVFDASNLSVDALKPFLDIASFGGDGWVKNTSHYMEGEHQRMISINSDPIGSLGARDYFTVESFIAAYPKLSKGNFAIERWTRLLAKINGKAVWPLGLNDVGIMTDDPFDMCRYVIDYKGVQEEQKTTGLIVSSGSGSTGWPHKIHITQQRDDGFFDKDAQFATFTIREEPIVELSEYSIVEGRIEKGEKLRITSYVDDLRVGPDTYKEYFDLASSGDEITVEISDSPLQMIRTY